MIHDDTAERTSSTSTNARLLHSRLHQAVTNRSRENSYEEDDENDIHNNNNNCKSKKLDIEDGHCGRYDDDDDDDDKSSSPWYFNKSRGSASSASTFFSLSTLVRILINRICRIFLSLSKFTFQIGVILLWYYTNGMNGISMQNYSQDFVVKSSVAGAGSGSSSSDTMKFLSIWIVTCIITSLQLLLGAIIGRAMLWILHRIQQRGQQRRMLRHKDSNTTHDDEEKRQLIINKSLVEPSSTNSKKSSTSPQHYYSLSALHGVGSIATNLGFMYGKASLVQILKLLEPFETLLISQLLVLWLVAAKSSRKTNRSTSTTTSSSNVCTIGIVSSMIVVVGSAMSLIKTTQSSTTTSPTQSPPKPAIAFAIFTVGG